MKNTQKSIGGIVWHVLAIILLFLFFLATGVFAQTGTHYYTITPTKYDSLEKVSWYQGRVFLNNGDEIDGMLHRNFETNCIEVKKADDHIKSFNGYAARGFYLINKNDTAWFVNLQINKQEWKGMRILVDGKGEGISLFRYAWISGEKSKWARFFNSQGFAIEWDYYIWKDNELKKILFNKHIKKAIDDKPATLKYYRQHTRSLNKTKYYAGTLIKIINLYNAEPID